jgi:hypothetical protein
VPDLDGAARGVVAVGPVALSDDTVLGERIVEVLPQIPTPVWGRDEAGLGEMWNSNSVIAWVLTASGIGARTLHAPAGGRAPGWLAGCTVAERSAAVAGPAVTEGSVPGRHDGPRSTSDPTVSGMS